MIEPNTEAWVKARLGRVTASKVSAVVAKTKSGYSTSRANYAAELIAERLTKVPTESFKSAAMQWGTDHEAEALSSYVFIHDATVTPAGFIEHPAIPMAGATPDGFAAPNGLVEVKCPLIATHLDTLLRQAIPGNYATQMQWQMACTGRKWTDYISYDPRVPENMRLFVKRLPRDDARIAELEAEVTAFLAEIDTAMANLGKLYPLPAPNPLHDLLMAG